MRLIDADALIERLKSDIIMRQNIIDEKISNGIKDYRDNQLIASYRLALDIICNAPTVVGECKDYEEVE